MRQEVVRFLKQTPEWQMRILSCYFDSITTIQTLTEYIDKHYEDMWKEYQEDKPDKGKIRILSNAVRRARASMTGLTQQLVELTMEPKKTVRLHEAKKQTKYLKGMKP